MAGGGRLAAKQFYGDLAAYNDGQGIPSEKWLFTYDEFGRQVRVERQTLDAQGAVTESLVTSYEFDAAGRQTRSESPEGVINYEYETLGRKTRTFTGDVADPIDDWHYTYDSLSRLASIVQPTRDKEPVDVFFVKTGQSLPDWVRPELTTYHYDLVGNLDWQLSDQLLVSTYDGTAEYRELTDYSYDALSRLDKVDHSHGWFTDLPIGSEPFAEFDYELRADGKRSGVAEKLQINDGNGRTAEQTNVTDWEYDALGRLVDEVFDTEFQFDGSPWDVTEDGSTRPLQDYADHYEFDLAGNRVRKTTDFDLSTAAVDQIFNYGFDANDRLLWEQSDLDADGVIDELASYSYGENNSATQQTSKTVVAGSALNSPLSTLSYSYDLQGRMATTVVERFATDGVTVAERESTSFGSDKRVRTLCCHNLSRQ